MEVTSIELEIEETRRDIRKKYNKFRRGEEEKEEQLKKKYEPLRDMIREAMVPKKSKEEEVSTLIDPWRYVTKRKRTKRSTYLDIFNNKPRYRTRETSTELSSEEKESASHSSQQLLETLPSGFISSTPEATEPDYGHYATSYVKKKINSELGFDDVYGVRYHKTPQRFTLGDSYVRFNEDLVEIGDDMKIECTPGLLELLFIENPDMNLVNTHDLMSYRRILDETKVHKKRFSSTEGYQVQPKHPKWSIIRQLYPTKKEESAKSKSGSST